MGVRAKQDAYKLISESSSNGSVGKSSRHSHSSRNRSTNVENWLTQSESAIASHSSCQPVNSTVGNAQCHLDDPTSSSPVVVILSCIRQQLLNIQNMQHQDNYDTIGAEIKKVDALHQELVDEM